MKIVDDICDSLRQEPDRWTFLKNDYMYERDDGLLVINLKLGFSMGVAIQKPVSIDLDWGSKRKLHKALKVWKKEGLRITNITEKKT